MLINARCPYCGAEIVDTETTENHGTWVRCWQCRNKSRVSVCQTQAGETVVRLSVVGKPNQGLTERYQIMLDEELHALLMLYGPQIVREHLDELRNDSIIPSNK